MISPTYLSDSYDRNVQIVRMQTDGFSQADSLIQLPFRGNCMNWLVGHLVTNRYNVLKLLGAELPAGAERLARYARESKPIQTNSEGVLPLAELIELLARAHAQMASLLVEISPEVLDRQVAFFGRRSQSVGEWLLFFYFHDSYHTGQTEILRQAAGKDDKII